MSRQRGSALQNALAKYLASWWPHAESAGAGRQGTDVLGTPGVAWECKTATDFRRDFRPNEWVAQSKQHAICKHCDAPECDHQRDVPVVVYFPPGIAKASAQHALAIVPLHVLMHLLECAEIAPDTTSPDFMLGLAEAIGKGR